MCIYIYIYFAVCNGSLKIIKKIFNRSFFATKMEDSLDSKQISSSLVLGMCLSFEIIFRSF